MYNVFVRTKHHTYVVLLDVVLGLGNGFNSGGVVILQGIDDIEVGVLTDLTVDTLRTIRAHLRIPHRIF